MERKVKPVQLTKAEASRMVLNLSDRSRALLAEVLREFEMVARQRIERQLAEKRRREWYNSPLK